MTVGSTGSINALPCMARQPPPHQLTLFPPDPGDEPIPPELVKDARRAVSMCPRLALAIERRER